MQTMNESTKNYSCNEFFFKSFTIFTSFKVQTLIFPQLNREILFRYPSVGIYTNFEVAMLKKALI